MTQAPDTHRHDRPSWLASLLIGIAATATVLVLQNVARTLWQIRTLPERVLEWLLLFIPLDLFERGLQQFGSNAKDLAFIGTLVGMGGLLLLIGALAVRAGWSSYSLLLLGLLLWVLAMAAVMPLTGGGMFATRQFVSPLLTNAIYLTLFLVFACVLIAGRLLASRDPIARQAVSGERRVLLTGIGGVVASLGVARFVARDGGLVTSTLPLAVAPTRVPTPQPTRASGGPVAPSAPTQAPPAVQQPPTVESLPPTPATRALERSRDGALTGAGRPRGSLAPAITSNEDFYVVTKNVVADPAVDPATWRLIVDGEVTRPIQLDYQTLRALPAVEITKTLECISNFTAQCHLAAFGCDLISTARFRGARLADLLDLAGGLTSNAVGLAVLSIDEFSAGLGVEVAADPETLVVYEMNGKPLSREHGYPARLLVPGRYGMKDPKWLAVIRVTPHEHLGWYEQRNWDKLGIVKTMARIDVPADGASLVPGVQRIAGIAYAGDRGVERVEFSADGGYIWEAASLLEPQPGRDAMVRWESTFTLHPGERRSLVVRATDGHGQVQTEEFKLPQPSGGSGRHKIEVWSAA